LTVRNRFNVVNPKDRSALNEVLQAIQEHRDAYLTLQPEDGGDLFTLVVSEVKLEQDDSSGLFLFDGTTDLGVVSVRLSPTPSADRPAGIITIVS